MKRLATAFSLLCALAPLSIQAADAFYVGTWKIESAMVAPWWNEAKKPDPAETKTLVGKTVTITAAGITGPRQVACRGPKYQVKDYPVVMLFQGMFEEAQRRDKLVDPQKLAAAAGFKGSSWKTVETGCGNELDYHLADPSTLVFGLNNYLYFLKKQ
jgi:hypothetical protein